MKGGRMEKRMVTITRTVPVPDERLIAACRKAPEAGPRLLFFSGGTALRELSRRLIDYTHNSIHLITPFDSGGSSAELRRAFGMLSVGDLRNRIMALADRGVTGNEDVYRLFGFRFPEQADNGELLSELERMIEGKNELVARVIDPMRKIIRNHLLYFREAMPADFDLRGASVGNLILVGGYLNNGRHIDPVLYLFSKLVEARGVVRPVVSEDLTLVAELEHGGRVAGQHLLARAARESRSRVTGIYLADNRSLTPVRVEIRNKVRDLILQADLICFPMGSFFSSVVANLLPMGVGKAVAENGCPKVYVPNTGGDPEQAGMNLVERVRCLISYLSRSAGDGLDPDRLLQFVVVDEGSEDGRDRESRERVRALGIEVLGFDLVSEESAPYLDEGRLLEVLLSLA